MVGQPPMGWLAPRVSVRKYGEGFRRGRIARARHGGRALHRSGPRRTGRHGRGLRGLRPRAGSQDRDQAAARRAATTATRRRRARAPDARGAGHRAKSRTPTWSWCTTSARSRTASSSRWSSSTATRCATGSQARRAPGGDPRRLHRRRAAAWRRRTRRSWCTATSSPTTSWSAPTGRCASWTSAWPAGRSIGDKPERGTASRRRACGEHRQRQRASSSIRLATLRHRGARSSPPNNAARDRRLPLDGS